VGVSVQRKGVRIGGDRQKPDKVRPSASHKKRTRVLVGLIFSFQKYEGDAGESQPSRTSEHPRRGKETRNNGGAIREEDDHR